MRFIDPHAAFEVDGLLVDPFPVPHDAREPVQFVVSDGAFRVGVLTDLGMSTPCVEQSLSGCDALVLETLTAFKRAGCSGVLTYHAAHAAQLLG